MKNQSPTSILFLVALVLFVQCKKEPSPVNENELITRLELIFTDSLTMERSTFLYCINDAVYGNRKDTIRIYANSTYNLQIRMYNVKSATDVDTISNEIIEENTTHQLFILSNSFQSFTYLDTDENGKPLGLLSRIITENNTDIIDILRVLLIHEPNKQAIGVDENDPTSANGNTDLDATLKLILQNRN
jgi:hypothetical protein